MFMEVGMSGMPGYEFKHLVVAASDLRLTHLGHWASVVVGRDTIFGRLISFDRDMNGGVTVRFEGRPGQPTLQADDHLTFIGSAPGGRIF